MRRRLTAVRSMLVPALALLAALSLPGCSPSQPLPQELQGTWRVQAGRYAGCAVTITSEWLSLETADGRRQVAVIEAIHIEQNGDFGAEPQYTVVYVESQGTRQTLTFRHVAGDPAALVLQNRDGTRWVHQGG